MPRSANSRSDLTECLVEVGGGRVGVGAGVSVGGTPVRVGVGGSMVGGTVVGVGILSPADWQEASNPVSSVTIRRLIILFLAIPPGNTL